VTPGGGLRFAVVGKGGVGKSFVAGTLARILAQRGRAVVVLDSDPVAGAAVSMGMGVISESMLTDAAVETPQGWRLQPGLGAATAIRQRSATGPDVVRLLQSGKAGADGLSHLWPSLRAFGQVTRRLARDGVLGTWDVIGDLPAGPRHTAFNWAPYADTYVVATTDGTMSRLTAQRLIRLARQRNAEVLLIVNRVDAATGARIADGLGLPATITIPEDDEVRAAEAAGGAPIDEAPDSVAVRHVRQLADTLIAQKAVTK
jgi:CO dehydrogenase maturation factor